MYSKESSARITSCCLLSNTHGGSVVVGDSSGRLRVLSNPVMSEKSIYLQFTSHHGSIQKIVLCGESLYTLGGDSCLCKWKVYSLSWPPTMPPSLYNDTIIIEEKKEDKHHSGRTRTRKLVRKHETHITVTVRPSTSSLRALAISSGRGSTSFRYSA